MVNLKFCYADAQVRALTVTSPASDVVKTTDTFPIGNALSGARHRHYRTDAQVTSTDIDIDLGSTGQTNPDYFIIARADFLKRGDSSDPVFTLEGDDNSSFTSPETSALTVTSAQLKGPHNEDIIKETSFTTSYRYWRLNIASTATIQHEISKIYFGNWLDLGRDPSYAPQIEFGEWSHTRRRRARTISLFFRGITTANRLLFETKVVANKDVHPLFLYDPNDYLFDGLQLIHCELLSHGWTIRHGGSDLSVTLMELI